MCHCAPARKHPTRNTSPKCFSFLYTCFHKNACVTTNLRRHLKGLSTDNLAQLCNLETLLLLENRRCSLKCTVHSKFHVTGGCTHFGQVLQQFIQCTRWTAQLHGYQFCPTSKTQCKEMQTLTTIVTVSKVCAAVCFARVETRRNRS